jgi:hypothetical protein
VKSTDSEKNAENMLARMNDDVCIQILTSLDVFELDFAYLYVVLRDDKDPLQSHVSGKIAFGRNNFIAQHRKELIWQYLRHILFPYCRLMFKLQFYKEESDKILGILEEKFREPSTSQFYGLSLDDLRSRRMPLIKIGQYCFEKFKE